MSTALRRRLGAYYRGLRTGTDCVYCGEVATGRDHFLPVSASVLLRALSIDIDDRCLVTLPACKECNTLAGARVFRTVAGKRRYIKRTLAKRNAKVLALRDWDQDELEELGWTLRTTIISGMHKRDQIKRRLAWLPASDVEKTLSRIDIGSGSARNLAAWDGMSRKRA